MPDQAPRATPPAPAADAAAPAHLSLGRVVEEAAAAFLARAGFAVLDRNWRQGRLELDMVCREGDTLVFVEVKTRSSPSRGGPAAAVTTAKQAALCRAALAWLAAHNAWARPCRFDVVGVARLGDTLHLEHYRHAFECPKTLDRGHTAWQPW